MIPFRRYNKHLLTALAVLAGAIASYAAGLSLDVGVLLVAGALLELALWIVALTGFTGSGEGN